MKLSKQKVMESAGKTKALKQKGLVVRDPRFARLHSDPRFQRSFKRKLKIPIDSRFRHIFSDKRFSEPLALDKRGRKLRKPTGKGHALHQYYHLHDGDEASPAETRANDGDAALRNPNAEATEKEKTAAQSFSEAHQQVKSPSEALQNGKRHILNGPSAKKKAKNEPFPTESCEAMPPHPEGSEAKVDSREKKLRAIDDALAKARHAENTSKEDSDHDNGSLEEEASVSDDESDGKDVYGESSETSSASSSSSEYSSDEEDMVDLPSEEEAEDEKVPVTETETRRLALVNMDWDHIRAVDILAVMNSFLPKGGQILSVSVFPSEFGLQQLKEEELRGPQGLFKSEGGDDDNEDADDGVNMERLRQYEKDKLRYYYAVVECESIETADFLYKSCDGMEFERTSNTLDLRFIPDDMKFLNSPRDVAMQVPADYQAPVFETRALQHSKVKLTWDDDEPDRVKTLHQKFNAEQLNDMDFKAYLASDASDSEGADDAEDDLEGNQPFLHDDKEHLDDPDTKEIGNGKKSLRDKYRALLVGSEEVSQGKDLPNKDQDMEITFHSGLEELSKRLMDKKKEKGGDENVWEAYLRKRKEKKKLQKQTRHAQEDDEDSADEHNAGGDPHFTQGDDANFDDPFFNSTEGMDFAASEGSDSEREIPVVPVAKQKKGARAQKRAELEEKKREDERSRAELELLFADELAAGSGVKGYNLKKKLKGKRKEAAEKLPDKLPTVNYEDSRFSALFTSHRFAIDPTEPEFKRSAAQLRSLLEKQQKHLPQVREVVDSNKSKHVDSEDVKVETSKKAKQELSLMVRSLKRKVGGVVET